MEAQPGVTAGRGYRLVAQGARELAHYRCGNHFQRLATQRCDSCSRLLCDECLRDTDWGHVCGVCEDQMYRRAELDRYRVRHAIFNTDMVPVLVVFALSVLMAGNLFLLSGGVDLRRDLGVKMQLFMEGSDPTNGILVSARANGGRATAASPAVAAFGVENLIDGLNEPDFGAWRSSEATFPQDIVLQMNLRGPIGRLEIRNHPLEPTDTWPSRAQILYADDDPRANPSDLTLIREVTLGERPSWRVDFDPIIARYVVVRLLANHGSSSYVSVGEIEVRTPPRAESPDSRVLDPAMPRIEP